MSTAFPGAASAQSLHELYRDHHGWLRGWLRQRLNNSADAADLAQDTFVRVLLARTAGTLQEPRHYLATIARGLVIDLYRRRSLEQAYLEALALRPEVYAPSAETRALILDKAITIWLDSEVDTLVERTARKENRPLLRGGNPREILGRLREERAQHYCQAPIHVLSSAGPHVQTINKVLQGISQWL